MNDLVRGQNSFTLRALRSKLVSSEAELATLADRMRQTEAEVLLKSQQKTDLLNELIRLQDLQRVKRRTVSQVQDNELDIAELNLGFLSQQQRKREKALQKLQLNKSLIWQDKIGRLVADISAENHEYARLTSQQEQVLQEAWRLKIQADALRKIVSQAEYELDQHHRVLAQVEQERRQKYGSQVVQSQQTLLQLAARQDELRFKELKGKKLHKQMSALLLKQALSKAVQIKLQQGVSLIREYSLAAREFKNVLICLRALLSKHITKTKRRAFRKWGRSCRLCSQPASILTMLLSAKTKKCVFQKLRQELVDRTIRAKQGHIFINRVAALFRVASYRVLKDGIQRLAIRQQKKRARKFMDLSQTAIRYRLLKLGLSAIRSTADEDRQNQGIRGQAQQLSQLHVKGLYLSNLNIFCKLNKTMGKMLMFKALRGLKEQKASGRAASLSEVLGGMLYKRFEKMHLVKVYAKWKLAHGKQLKQLRSQTEKQAVGNSVESKQSLDIGLAEYMEQMKRVYIARQAQLYLKTRNRYFGHWLGRSKERQASRLLVGLLRNKLLVKSNLGLQQLRKDKFCRLKKSIESKIQTLDFSLSYVEDQNRNIKKVLDTKTLARQKHLISICLRLSIRQSFESKVKKFNRYRRRVRQLGKIHRACRLVAAIASRKIMQNAVLSISYGLIAARQQSQLEEQIGILNRIQEERNAGRVFSNYQREAGLSRTLKALFSKIQISFKKLNSARAFSVLKSCHHQLRLNIQYGELLEAKAKKEQASNDGERLEKELTRMSSLAEKVRQIALRRHSLVLLERYKRGMYLAARSRFAAWRKKTRKYNSVPRMLELLRRKYQKYAVLPAFKSIFGRSEAKLLELLKKKLSLDQASRKDSLQNAESRSISDAKEAKSYEEQAEVLQENTRMMRKANKKISLNLSKGQLQTFNQRRLKRLLTRWAQFIKYQKIAGQIIFEKAGRVQLLSCKAAIEQCKAQSIRVGKQRLIEMRLFSVAAKVSHNWRSSAFGQLSFFTVNHKQKQLTGQRKLMQQRLADVLNKQLRTTGLLLKQHSAFRTRRQLILVFSEAKSILRVKMRNQQGKRTIMALLERIRKQKSMHIFRARLLGRVAKQHKILKFAQESDRRRKYLLLKELVVNSRGGEFLSRHLSKLQQYLEYQLLLVAFQKVRGYYFRLQNYRCSIQLAKLSRAFQLSQQAESIFLRTVFKQINENLFIIEKRRIVLRGIVRAAIVNQLRPLFYCWRCKAEVEQIFYYHKQEGEIRKDVVQFKKTLAAVQKFKQSKGLLVEDESGKLVPSARFAENEQVQTERNYRLRYQVVAKLMAFSSQLNPMLRALNSWKLFYTMRKRYKRAATNMQLLRRKGDLFQLFRLWKKAARDFRKELQGMDRNDLTRLVIKEKEKLMNVYTGAANSQDRINQVMVKFNILNAQETRRMKLSLLSLLHNFNLKRKAAFRLWYCNALALAEHTQLSIIRRGQSQFSVVEAEVLQLREELDNVEKVRMDLLQLSDEGAEIAEAVRFLSLQRTELAREIQQKSVTIQNLARQNRELQRRLREASQEVQKLVTLARLA